tara:strand:+ start:105 stop:1037 length:933 start_codon:yes stop_codon:yes gene_type:complete
MVKCKICGKEFESDKQLHSHLKAHKMRVVEYYQTQFPRYDLHTGEIIKFKNKEQYFETDFNSRTSLRMWLKGQPEKDRIDYLTNLIKERKNKKDLVYTPSQVELRSTVIPSIVFYQKYLDYYKVCKKLGLKNKYKNASSIALGSEYKNKDYKIYIDTREQTPLKIDYPTEIKCLKFGDYTLSNKDLTCNCYIERKSLADFISTISVMNLERFKREIERAGEADANLIILVEDTLSHALSFNHLPYISKKIRATPEFIFKNVRDLIQEYPHIQFLFVNGRKESVRVMKKIFFSNCLYKDIDLQLAYDRKIL